MYRLVQKMTVVSYRFNFHRKVLLPLLLIHGLVFICEKIYGLTYVSVIVGFLSKKI